MARTWDNNTSNYMSLGTNAIGPLIHGASAVSFHFNLTFNTIVNGNRFFQIIMFFGNIGIYCYSTATSIFVAGRSTTTDFATCQDDAVTGISTGVPYSVGGVMDFGGDALRNYRNGVLHRTVANTWDSPTYNNPDTASVDDYIGGPPTANQLVDGEVSELAIWKGDIGTAGFESLNEGISAKLIRPHLLVNYWPILGNGSTEVDEVSGIDGTVTGTLAKADHPRIILPRSRSRVLVPTAAAAGRGTLQVMIS